MPRRSENEPAVAGIPGGLDKLLEHRLRLTLCVLLSRYEQISFSRFKQITGETDGNLGANLRRLEDAGYVRVRKEFDDRRPVSWYALSAAGKRTLKKHVAALSTLIEGAG
ncbi:MAG: transcriptional regulator [bacterium]|nr:transcriptional regulator [bacterium]